MDLPKFIQNFTSVTQTWRKPNRLCKVIATSTKNLVKSQDLSLVKYYHFHEGIKKWNCDWSFFESYSLVKTQYNDGVTTNKWHNPRKLPVIIRKKNISSFEYLKKIWTNSQIVPEHVVKR